MNELKDKDLREALRRRETHRTKPEGPADFMDNVMQRIEEPATAPQPRARRVWLYAAAAVAASIVLLIVFHHGQEQTPQESLVAQTVEANQGDRSLIGDEARDQATSPSDSRDEPRDQATSPTDSRKPVKKQRKVVTRLVELIPTSEAKSDNVKELPESLIAKVKAYDQKSDPSRTTGIDDQAPLVERTMGIDAPDPLVAMTAQVEDIRQRGQRLQKDIDNRMDN